MLDALRKGAGGWLAQLFIALLVVSFAVWGVSDIFTGFRSDTVATVGGSNVSVRAFQRQYDMSTRQLSQQIGQQITPEQAQMFGLPGQVLGQLVAEATLNDEASRLRLGISSETLAHEIAADPSFRGATGSFDRSVFAQLLRSAGLTEDDYLASLRDNYVRQQIGDALIGGVAVPDTYLKALHDFRSQERSLGYLVLLPALVTDVGEPADTDLIAFFDTNKSVYKAPEYRALKVVRMAPEDLAATGDISDEEARKTYDQAVATRFTTPERRQVQQIVFKDKTDADAAVAALAAGKTFDDLLAERQITATDADLGLVTRDKLLDPKVADAAFALAANGVSGIVGGRFGPVMVRVTTLGPRAVRRGQGGYQEGARRGPRRGRDRRPARRHRGCPRRRRHARGHRRQVRPEGRHRAGRRPGGQGREGQPDRRHSRRHRDHPGRLPVRRRHRERPGPVRAEQLRLV
ncbi:MAG TPA: peptidylprolyl isomerase, partial [Bauldia sp.]|nr:peptidylprolyl isomerase [Bauldia sp.]